MSKIGLIIQREYLTKVKKRSFIVMTILGPLLFSGLMIGAIFLTMNDDTQYDVLVVDKAGVISEYNADASQIVPRFPKKFNENDPHLKYAFVSEEIGSEAFKEGPFNVMILLDDQTLNDGKCSFYFKKFPSETIRSEVRDDIQESLERFRVTDSLQIDYEVYKRMKMKVDFVNININKLGEEDHTQAKASIGFAFAIMIYLFIFLYGVQVMRGVTEEKTNRIIEVIISSVKPFELMMGKVIGIGLVGLTQLLIWVIFSGIISAIGISYFESQLIGGANLVENAQHIAVGTDQAMMMQKFMENDAISWFFMINWPLMLGLFVFYFLGGYFLYASLFAAIGAAVDSETDTQQFMMPVTLPLIFSYVVSAMMIQNPESSVGTFFSVFPLTSPITMMVKSIISPSPLLIISSMLILIVTFLFFIWIAGRIYRIGILMYGKKASYKELWKWMWYK